MVSLLVLPRRAISEVLDPTEFTQRWIVDDNWTYTADLSSILKKESKSEKTLLVFYGLDTIANIVLHFLPSQSSLS